MNQESTVLEVRIRFIEPELLSLLFWRAGPHPGRFFLWARHVRFVERDVLTCLNPCCVRCSVVFFSICLVGDSYFIYLIDCIVLHINRIHLYIMESNTIFISDDVCVVLQYHRRWEPFTLWITGVQPLLLVKLLLFSLCSIIEGLFVLFIRSLYCLSVCDLRLLVTSLIYLQTFLISVFILLYLHSSIINKT